MAYEIVEIVWRERRRVRSALAVLREAQPSPTSHWAAGQLAFASRVRVQFI